MIRRKLTRLEVTLDDTKELDELFSSSKCHSINLVNTGSITATTSLNNSANISRISSNFHQKQMLLIGKDNETSNIIDTSVTKANSSSVDPDDSNLRNTPATITTETANSSTSETGYNPQPHNPSSRFQFNTDSQQLR